MYSIALSMLLGDKVKCWGLIFGVTFSTLLITQQISIFVGLMARVSSLILSIPEASVWVMDPRSAYIEEIHPLPEINLQKVRSIRGVLWAVPFHKSTVSATTKDGRLHQVQIVGVDPFSFLGMNKALTHGFLDHLRHPLNGILDTSGYQRIWPSSATHLPKMLTVQHHRLSIQGLCESRPTFFSFPLLYVSYYTAKSMMAKKSSPLSFILVKERNGISPQALAKKITKKTGLQAITQSAFSEKSIRYVLKRTGIPINFAITILLGALVGGAIIAQTFYLFFMENLKQFAAMKIMGVSNATLTRMALTQAGCVGSIGYGLGVGLTALFLWSQRNAPAFKGFFLHWQVLVISFTVVTVVILLSIALSLRKLFKIDPIMVFRGG
ncbi:ABC transporter permease [Holospora undulata]|uniref:ABC exporter transmembrane subunit, DevC protein n=1 Tax=Holospora undulata HU1 TaxID=1321371 RepID=A0A061JGG6_9PROT|nr:ABC transporter permease [Holospora undulata]ETZ05151.1 ABC exporter transmembrane subunit, DevC protein [Holospora undulata HU1]